jgi:hypothetical protein
MQHRANSGLAEVTAGWTVDEARAKAKRVGRGIVELLTVCADGWAAANMYQELSRPSDAELARRWTSRVELARHVLGVSSR